MNNYIITEEQSKLLFEHLILNENLYQSLGTGLGKITKNVKNAAGNTLNNLKTIGGPNNAIYKKQFPDINIDRLNKTTKLSNQSEKRSNRFNLVGIGGVDTNSTKQLIIELKNPQDLEQKIYAKVLKNLINNINVNGQTLEKLGLTNEITKLFTLLEQNIKNEQGFTINNNNFIVSKTNTIFISKPTKKQNKYIFGVNFFLDKEEILRNINQTTLNQPFINYINNINKYLTLSSRFTFNYDISHKTYNKLNVYNTSNTSLITYDIINLKIIE